MTTRSAPGGRDVLPGPRARDVEPVLPEDQPEPSWRQWGWSFGVLAVLLLMVATMGVPGGRMPEPVPWLVALGIAVAALVTVRRAAQQRRDYRERLHQAAVRQAVQRDRLAVATELHDVISHGLGAITVRARAGQRLATGDPAAAALADVVQLSRGATDDLRALLGLLRDPEASVPVAPAPGLADVAGLLDRAREAGIAVTAEGLDTPGCTPGEELTVHHVVREALANTARHAGPTRANVRVRRLPGALEVQVDDEGPRPGWTAVPGAGHGLELLALRVRSHGGRLVAGPVGNGFRVSAELPEDRHA